MELGDSGGFRFGVVIYDVVSPKTAGISRVNEVGEDFEIDFFHFVISFVVFDIII